MSVDATPTAIDVQLSIDPTGDSNFHQNHAEPSSPSDDLKITIDKIRLTIQNSVTQPQDTPRSNISNTNINSQIKGKN